MKARDKTFLVTGGTGSFGNFIVNRLLSLNAKEIRVFSRDEKKQYDMRNHYREAENLKFIIGDIRDEKRVRESMAGVNIVLQAAALKHVPICENNPGEAVSTNITGVQNVIAAALDENVEKFISISTDKSVKPVNVMGMTKALQERLTISANLSHKNLNTLFACVRYGNVLSSRGSVIPFFRQKLSRKETLTITDVEMTRFLLTLEDAIDLVIFALENTLGGEIFVKKSPSARILDLARLICKEFGNELDYKVIGKFPGEKVHEILISEEELLRSVDMSDYIKIQPHWRKESNMDITSEYSSKDHIIEKEEELKDLINRSDLEMDKVSFEGTDYSKVWAK